MTIVRTRIIDVHYYSCGADSETCACGGWLIVAFSQVLQTNAQLAFMCVYFVILFYVCLEARSQGAAANCLAFGIERLGKEYDASVWGRTSPSIAALGTRP